MYGDRCQSAGATRTVPKQLGKIGLLKMRRSGLEAHAVSQGIPISCCVRISMFKAKKVKRGLGAWMGR